MSLVRWQVVWNVSKTLLKTFCPSVQGDTTAAMRWFKTWWGLSKTKRLWGTFLKFSQFLSPSPDVTERFLQETNRLRLEEADVSLKRRYRRPPPVWSTVWPVLARALGLWQERVERQLLQRATRYRVHPLPQRRHFPRVVHGCAQLSSEDRVEFFFHLEMSRKHYKICLPLLMTYCTSVRMNYDGYENHKYFLTIYATIGVSMNRMARLEFQWIDLGGDTSEVNDWSRRSLWSYSLSACDNFIHQMIGFFFERGSQELSNDINVAS